MVQWYQGMTLDQLEKLVIKKSLELNGGNKTQTAIALGIAIRTLQNKLAEMEAEVIANAQAADERKQKAAEELARARGIKYDSMGLAVLPAGKI